MYDYNLLKKNTSLVVHLMLLMLLFVLLLFVALLLVVVATVLRVVERNRYLISCTCFVVDSGCSFKEVCYFDTVIVL